MRFLLTAASFSTVAFAQRANDCFAADFAGLASNASGFATCIVSDDLQPCLQESMHVTALCADYIDFISGDYFGDCETPCDLDNASDDCVVCSSAGWMMIGAALAQHDGGKCKADMADIKAVSLADVMTCGANNRTSGGYCLGNVAEVSPVCATCIDSTFATNNATCGDLCNTDNTTYGCRNCVYAASLGTIVTCDSGIAGMVGMSALSLAVLLAVSFVLA